MRANFAFSTLTATALMCAATASAAVLTITPSAPGLSGVSAAGAAGSTAATGTDVISSTPGSTTAKSLQTEVITAPTTTSSGLAYLYEVTTVSKTLTNTVGSYDYFSWEQSLTGNTPGQEYLTFSATVSATEAVSGNFGVYSSGSFTSASSPFGVSVPALPSYYYRLGGTGAWTLMGSSNYTTSLDSTGGTFSGAESSWLTLAAGTSTTLEIAVLAGSNVNLSTVGLSLFSGYYGQHTEVVDLGATTTKTLLSAQLLSPVPEPETYALILAGLLFAGLRMRSQR